MPALSLNKSASSRFRPASWRLGVSLAIAACLTVVGLHFGTPGARQNAERVALVHSSERINEIGLTTLGGAYLQVAGSSATVPTATVDQGVLQSIRRMIEPLDPQGAFYPLRKLSEHIAEVLLIPIFLVAVAVGLIENRGEYEEASQKIFIRLIAVLAMLYLYPLWDRVIFGAATRITAVLVDPAITQQMANSIGQNKTGALPSSIPNFGNGLTDASAALSQYSSSWLGCTAEIVTNDPNHSTANAGASCFGNNIPTAVQNMDANSMRSIQMGSAADGQSYMAGHMSSGDPTTANAQQAFASSSGDQGYLSQAWGAITGAATSAYSYVMDNVGNFLTSTLTGWLLSLESLLMGALLWFVWLGVIFGRALSLALAPLAIVWHMWPSGNQGVNWFKGHAKMVMKPVGVALVTLGLFVIQAGIIGTPVLGGLAGLGIKTAIFILTMLALYRGITLTDLMAGDVADVAAKFGSAAEKTSIQMVGTAAKLSLVAATGGAAAAAGGAGAAAGTAAASSAGGGVVGAAELETAAGSTASALSNVGAGAEAGGAGGAGAGSGGISLPDAPSSPGGGRGLFGDALGGQPKTGGSSVGRDWGTGSKIGRGLKATFRGARFAWENRMRYEDAQSVGGFFRSGVAQPVQQGYNQISESYEKARAKAADKAIGRVADETASALGQGPAQRERIRQAEEDYGVKVGARRNEQVPINAADLKSSLASPEARAMATQMASSLLAGMIAAGVAPELGMGRRRGEPIIASLDDSTKKAMRDLLHSDRSLNDTLMARARNLYGSDSKIPMVGVDGRPVHRDAEGNYEDGEDAVLDVQTLMARDAVVADAVALAAQAITARDAELYRRELASYFGRADKNVPETDSVRERALRSLDPAFTERRTDVNGDPESDDAFTHRLQVAAQRVMRLAYFLQASESELSTAGLSKATPMAEVADSPAMDSTIQRAQWANVGSFTVLAPGAAQAFGQALNAERVILGDLYRQQTLVGGTRVGLNVDRFLASSGKEVEYAYQPESLFANQIRQYETEHPPLPPELAAVADPEAESRLQQDLYERAVRTVLESPALASQLPPLEPGESEAAWRERVRDDLNEILFAARSE